VSISAASSTVAPLPDALPIPLLFWNARNHSDAIFAPQKCAYFSASYSLSFVFTRIQIDSGTDSGTDSGIDSTSGRRSDS
jgi:hypothetical protein